MSLIIQEITVNYQEVLLSDLEKHLQHCKLCDELYSKLDLLAKDVLNELVAIQKEALENLQSKLKSKNEIAANHYLEGLEVLAELKITFLQRKINSLNETMKKHSFKIACCVIPLKNYIK